MTPTPDTAAIRETFPVMHEGCGVDCPRFDHGCAIHALCDEVDRLREERRWRPASEPPPEHGYYLVAHERSGKFDKSPTVSQAWFNPDSNGSKWWASRGYLDKPPQNNNPIPDVIAWQPMPDAAPLPDLPKGG